MFKPADLPDRIPLFPLPGALLLPRAHLPLNIFEPRYLAMTEDALTTPHRLIGMVQPLDGKAEEGSDSALHAVGCAGRIMAFVETEDGRYRITLGGVARFRVTDLQPGFKPYPTASIDWAEFDHDLDKPQGDPGFDRQHFLDVLGRFLDARGSDTDWSSLEKAEDELLINSMAMMFPFDHEEKQALLESPTLADRRQTLITLMEFSLASGGEDRNLQ